MARPDPITWAALRAKLTTLPLPSTNAGCLAVLGGIILLLLLVLFWYAAEQKDDKGAATYPHASLINPILGGLGALFLIYAAIRQARTGTEQAETARKQAQIASDRHEAQTKADLQRRITEGFSKAIEQLGSDKLEVRLGGIYALERISQESARDYYWTVMENLTAFVRERTQRTEAERTAKPLDQRIRERGYVLWEQSGRPDGQSEKFWAEAVEREKYGEPPGADVAAVLTVIGRRSQDHRELEGTFDFREAILKVANLRWAHLEGANLDGAHLEGANLRWAHLERAQLGEAHLQRADLSWAHLEGANLGGAHLEGAYLGGAHLEGANLGGAHLEGASLGDAHLEGAYLGHAHLKGAYLGDAHLKGANLYGTHLEGADLRKTEGVTPGGINCAFGDAETALPAGLTRPAHWPAPKAPEEDEEGTAQLPAA